MKGFADYRWPKQDWSSWISPKVLWIPNSIQRPKNGFNHPISWLKLSNIFVYTFFLVLFFLYFFFYIYIYIYIYSLMCNKSNKRSIARAQRGWRTSFVHYQFFDTNRCEERRCAASIGPLWEPVELRVVKSICVGGVGWGLIGHP